MTIEELIPQVYPMILQYGLPLVLALIAWLIGSRVIKFILKASGALLDDKIPDPNLRDYVKKALTITLKIFLLSGVLGIIGVTLTPLITLLASFTLVIGLALSNMLNNLASGILMLFLKPFNEGDTIDVNDITGEVQKFTIFKTQLKTPENRVILVPNSDLSNSFIGVTPQEKIKKVEWDIGVSDDSDIEQAKKMLQVLCQEDIRIHDDPKAFVAVSELAEGHVKLLMQAWVNTSDASSVFYAMNENVYHAFAKEGINLQLLRARNNSMSSLHYEMSRSRGSFLAEQNNTGVGAKWRK